MPFDISELKINGLKIITPKFHKDQRGIFYESYKKRDFEKLGITNEFVQSNVSVSKINGLRGLHFQVKPSAQAKLVTVLKGSIFDVAVDIRKGSPTFGQYQSIELSEEDGKMFWLPEGFAHGFLSLKDNTKVMYWVTSEYSPQHERGIIWNDPSIGIKWPSITPILSEKDLEFKRLEEADINFTYSDN